uniref:Uncharacterized protein n=1 Tax=Cryptomonas curvata TaxID=233186 RepID=A0A7S0MZZ2_9CRYP|mmetsp:Transcript_5599/g.12446  ORF Transcript_5599/g.12446 Transcript_5599/m.12446 type:complete len:464 (+) Transcript_5599:229-1620(+)
MADAAATNGHTEETSIESETYHDQAAVKAQAMKVLMKEHKGEVEGLLVEQEEEWFNDDPFLIINMDNNAAQDSKKEVKVYGAQTEYHEYGVHIDDWWIGTSRAMLAIVYLVLFALVAIVIWQFMYYSYQEHVIAWVIGAIFVGLAVPLSLQDIHYHVLHYVSPLQRHYIRILWMVPLYSVESWLALRFNEQKMYLETLREMYESYVVYSLFKLMREFLGTKEVAVWKLSKVASKHGKTVAKHPFPCCCLMPWQLNAQFLTRSSLGVWQYVIIRTFLAVLSCVFEAYHMYGEGTMDWGKLYPYTVLILNTSQCWALYCLVLFYHELKDELAPINPLGKFLVVKAVVFFSWWQQIIIAGMASMEMVHPMLDYSAEDVAKGMQNLLIVVEMLVYAVCHKFIFSYTDFRAGGPLQQYLDETRAARKELKKAVVDMLPTDVIMEGGEYVKKAKRYVKKKVAPAAADSA